MNYYTLKRYVENGWLPRLAVVVFSVCQTETGKLVKYDENVRHERAQVELGNHLIKVYHGPAENSIRSRLQRNEKYVHVPGETPCVKTSLFCSSAVGSCLSNNEGLRESIIKFKEMLLVHTYVP